MTSTLSPPVVPARPASQSATPPRPPTAPERRDLTSRRDADWPRTTRITPWLIAGFIVMLWLLPFDTITLAVSLPFSLMLDRIVLPVVLVVWCLALAVGGRNRPRLKLTPIHVAVGTYLAIVYLSVIVNVGWLNHQLLLQSSIKQLVLVTSFAMFFLIVASVVRPTEVPAFLKLSLILAVICAVGALWEYKHHVNYFYQWPTSLLPSSIFSVSPPTSATVDELGRHQIFGPTENPLELATMLSMALPLTVVGVMRSTRRRTRVLYLVGCALVLAACFATYRKSSVILPTAVILMLIAVRPRQAVRLWPLAIILFVAIHVLAPGAFSSVINELSPGRFSSVDTTAHRASGYEAIRPLVWSRPLLGMGYGSYNANVNLILDSQALTSLLETGLLGLLGYLGMMVTTFVTARSLFHGRSSTQAWLALAMGLAAIAFFVASFLYDAESSFPHGPYIFLTFAAFVAVLYSNRDAKDPARSAGSRLRR